MINNLPSVQYNNVPKRDIIAPVTKIMATEIKPFISNPQSKSKNSANNSYSRPSGFNSQTINPLFAAHILFEAGEGGNEDAKIYGNRAYNKKASAVQNLWAIA